MMNRRSCLLHGLAAILIAPAVSAADFPTIEVYKSPTCGCCSKWIDYLRDNGFTVNATDVDDVSAVKRANNVPGEFSSCHTALVDGYVVEGHVPAEDIMRLLTERPEVAGITVPGMPMGSPGMESPNPVSYQVLSFTKSGNVKVFATHSP